MMPMFRTAQLNALCSPAMAVGATVFIRRGFDPAERLDVPVSPRQL